MKKWIVLILSLSLIFSGLPQGAVGLGNVNKSYNPEAVRMVVETAPGMDLQALALASGAELVRTGPMNYSTLEFKTELNEKSNKEEPDNSWGHSCTEEILSLQQVCPLEEKLQKVLDYPGVLGAEWSKTFKVHNVETATFSVMVTEPEYSLQWYLRNIRADKVWETGARGQGVIVAVVDTGIDLTHPEFNDAGLGMNNIIKGYNAFTRSSAPGAVQDDNGHGTSTAGVIAALKNNNGIIGIAHNAKIMPIKAMDKAGEGEDSIIADGIIWAADNGAKIINLSIGAEVQSKILDDALRYASDKGCLIVGASGNKKGSLDDQSNKIQATATNKVAFPGADPHVIAVSAVDRYDVITDFSLTGPEVFLTAPGNRILTTYWSATESTLAYSTGTSIAAPMVSASAALLWSAYPSLRAKDIEQALIGSAYDLGAIGRDAQYGFGRLDVYRALQTLQAQQSYPSPASIGWEGGRIFTGGTPNQPTAELSIQPGTFNVQIDNNGMDNKVNITLNSTTTPGDFPGGISPAGDSYRIDLLGEEPVSRPLTLTLRLTPPGEQINQSVISYLYKWSNYRWIRVGGGVSHSSAQMEATIYEPGIYRAGWSQEPVRDRISGTDRISTALEIAGEAFPTGADTVIVARADSFPDALAGAPLAYMYQAPILLTFSERLPVEVYQTIEELAPVNIIILGGTGAVSLIVEDELSKLTYVSRIAGANRYATAAAVADIMGMRGQAIVVNSANFPDAIAAAAHASYQGKPILLTPADTLVSETEAILRKLSITQTQVIGGTSAITSKVYTKLIHPTRLSGADRFATSAGVIQANHPEGRILYIATGLNFPDALTGGVLATTNSSNILLIPKAGPTRAQTELLRTLKGRKAVALGGEGAVSTEALRKIQALLQ